MERLREKHGQLTDHFAVAHGDEGGGPKWRYFVDHGLSRAECESLREIVREALQCKPLDSFDWQTAYLPIVVCAVEVGYGYRGNGTDFWPKLAETLSHEFGFDDRNRLSNWFAKASAKYGGVTPGSSDWEQAFRHIAWPITHAVAAKDIRRPFADCLRRFRRNVENEKLTDETIVADLSRISTQVGSRRFRTWMQRPDVVAGIVRDLLGGKPLDEAGLFSKLFRDRLIEDLRNEPEIRRAVRQVESGRKTGLKENHDDAAGNQPEAERFGEFFLRQDENGGLELCGEMPELPKLIQLSLKPIRGRWKARPWGRGGASPIPSDCLRSIRGHFPVSFSYLARANAETPFFTGVDELSVDQDAKLWLESVRFPAAEMLAFPPMNADDDSSHAIVGRTPHRGRIWVAARRGEIELRRSEEDESYCNLIGPIEGGEVWEFDADNAEVRQWLGWPPANAVDTQTGPAFTWLRPSPVSIDAKNQPVYTTDDEIGISVVGDKPVQLVLKKGSKEIVSESVSSVAMLTLDSRESYELLVQCDGEEIESFSFVIVDDKGDGFIEPDPETPWHAVVSHVDAGEIELSRKDLFNRRLNLDIIGDRGIENLNAKLTVMPGEAVASVRLDRIPTRLSATHPVWDELCDRLPPSVLKSPCDLSLSVEIEDLSHDTWLLEAELQELWWEDNADGMPIAVSDSGSLDVRNHCVIKGVSIDEPTDGDPFISVALDADGNELHFDARVGLVGDAFLSRKPDEPQRSLRQMDDVGSVPGMRSITQRYLQLSSATSSSITAEVNRVGAAGALRDWILNSVCGRNWVQKQRESSKIESVNPVAIWWECQASEEDLLQPPPEEVRELPPTLPNLVLAEFADVLPVGWWDGSIAEVEPDDAEPLDSIFQHLIDDDTVIVDAEALTTSLRHANQKLCGGHLADLLIPADAGDELLAWHVTEMSITNCATELLGWIRRSLSRGRGRQTWSSGELQIWLNLLLYPERLRKHPWESVVEKLLQDRPVARAGAFLAWRVEQVRRLESSLMLEPHS
ncbi:hypothetical protein [Allorhodopirellula heiligendammensis]|uniref:Uncharacterized protein n=1 Tax=Allorhodopirellula heiligendammensis TaxID=2714739 RepID=A0A5C6BFQ7_9BACT|nr:hypothetical protein [Allorhodopirellula heiligendammensis]TWU10522.1 hypothetical protein Poly21_44270 [Allorhodopirellula heiligendammensis]